ncbi:hypothetical protein F3Y22_tig00111834pilonHSYRG00039 [Hibiscus syriacus]|uniref:Uncharacterized protein n=1 Tax=Hibiscus syriacus TaxID=106335 RepID=A0A6A2XS88_HIBSY|nr:hypothetical protein F3Y22_tig00111834pilonHSYRG00039 [Hibiscus syriacus]
MWRTSTGLHQSLPQLLSGNHRSRPTGSIIGSGVSLLGESAYYGVAPLYRRTEG